MRQSTAESASSDSLDVGWNYNQSKRNIEEEEAEALAKVRSMVVEEVPHPALSGLAPPTPQILIHVQPSGKEGRDDDVSLCTCFILIFYSTILSFMLIPHSDSTILSF